MTNEQLYYEIQARLSRIKYDIDRIFSTGTWEEQVVIEKQKVDLTIKSIEKSIKNHNLEQTNDVDTQEMISCLEQIFRELDYIERDPLLHVKSISTLLTRILGILPKPISRNTSRRNNLDFEKYIDKMEEFERTCNQLNQIRENIYSLHTGIKNRDKEISKQAQEIQEKYNAICQDEDKDSLYTEIVKNSGKISQIKKQADEQLKIILQELGEFEEKFQKNNEFLNELEQQKQRISNWEKEIENLLKKATNASLASSYEKTQKDYENSIYFWNVFFILCMGGIMGISWNLFENIDVKDYLSVLSLFVARSPFYVPLAWLAIFATNRRNENKRLQEEYKHKETLAKAYSGYKEQIEKLEDTRAKELAEKLMNNLVEMTNENPNRALDKVKMEKIPIFEILEKLKDLPKEVLSLISKAKN